MANLIHSIFFSVPFTKNRLHQRESVYCYIDNSSPYLTISLDESIKLISSNILNSEFLIVIHHQKS